MEPIVLGNTTQSLQIVTEAGAATGFTFVCSYADNNGTTFTEGVTTGASNGTSPVTVAAAPASGYRRIIKSLVVKNNTGGSYTLTVTYNDNTNLRNIVAVLLADKDRWTTNGTYDGNGAFKEVTGTPQVVVAAGKVLNVSNSLTLAGTDSTTTTFPSSSDTVLGRASTDSVTGAKTFDSSALKMKGSSTGVTTIASANAGDSNYTQTLPAATGTVALVTGTSDTITVGSIELGAATDTTLARVSAGVASIEGANIMTVSSNDTVTGTKTCSNLVLADAGKLKYTVPGTDSTATGDITDEFNSGYSSTAIRDLVYLDSSSTWQKCDCSTSVTTYGSGPIGIALEVKSSGQACKVLLRGFVYATAFPTLTIGAPVYMSTAGAVVVTQPSTANYAIRVVGYGVHADKMYFNPSNDYIVHV